jgi:hypothetical protein
MAMDAIIAAVLVGIAMTAIMIYRPAKGRYIVARLRRLIDK